MNTLLTNRITNYIRHTTYIYLLKLRFFFLMICSVRFLRFTEHKMEKLIKKYLPNSYTKLASDSCNNNDRERCGKCKQNTEKSVYDNFLFCITQNHLADNIFCPPTVSALKENK